MTNMETSASAQLPRTGNWLRRIISAFGRARARRMALRELYALDNRLLQDIGLRRDEVREAVSAMFRTVPVAEASQPAREAAVSGIAAVGEHNDRHYQSAA